jgi:RimJ/RimL family protein N-acetyltransferase
VEFELQRLRLDHEAAVLDFEQVNRAYFAKTINDRGDEFFQKFPERHSEMLAQQAAGDCVFHILVEGDGTVIGRFNLFDIVGGTAVVGYRLAQSVSGRGVATTELRNLCRIASEEYGLRTLRAATSNDNVASLRVLKKVGFVATGPADVVGRKGTWYEVDLAIP